MKNRTQILNQNLIPLHRIPEYVGLSMALYNLHHHMQFLVDNNVVQPFFLGKEEVDQHPYFHLDVCISLVALLSSSMFVAAFLKTGLNLRDSRLVVASMRLR